MRAQLKDGSHVIHFDSVGRDEWKVVVWKWLDGLYDPLKEGH